MRHPDRAAASRGSTIELGNNLRANIAAKIGTDYAPDNPVLAAQNLAKAALA